MISEAQVEGALSFLDSSAEILGQAKEMAIRAERMLKRKRAVLASNAPERSEAARERWALCHDDYLGLVNDEATAAGQYEYMRAKRDAAALLVEVWRTQQASLRSGII